LGHAPTGGEHPCPLIRTRCSSATAHSAKRDGRHTSRQATTSLASARAVPRPMSGHRPGRLESKVRRWPVPRDRPPVRFVRYLNGERAGVDRGPVRLGGSHEAEPLDVGHRGVGTRHGLGGRGTGATACARHGATPPRHRHGGPSARHLDARRPSRGQPHGWPVQRGLGRDARRTSRPAGPTSSSTPGSTATLLGTSCSDSTR
jgi:hypothetical protein